MSFFIGLAVGLVVGFVACYAFLYLSCFYSFVFSLPCFTPQLLDCPLSQRLLNRTFYPGKCRSEANKCLVRHHI